MKNTMLYIICSLLFLLPILIILPILLPLIALLMWLAVLLGSDYIISAFGTWIVDPTQETWLMRYKIIWLIPIVLILSCFFSGPNAFIYIIITLTFGMLTALTGRKKHYW